MIQYPSPYVVARILGTGIFEMSPPLINPPGGIVKRPGTTLITTFDQPVIHLEAVEHGDWCLVRVHLEDGSIRYLSNGGPVLLEGGK